MAVTLEKVLRQLGESLVTDIKNQIQKKRNHLDETNSTLLKSLRYDLDGKQLMIIAPEAPYEVIVDKGRRPGSYVPLKDIRKWISEKNIKAKDVEPERLPYAIVNSIFKKNIEGVNFSENAFNKFGPIIAQSVGVEYQKELQRIMNELEAIK
tara:strand:+ start:41 stop:496 length:456 start_codon:yes stop_codon:yes gene_type:complete